jgi:hypothetical protein
VIRATRSRRSTEAAARLVEAASPECRNVVITAAELLRHPDRATPRMRARVFRDAEARSAGIPVARAAGLSRPAWILVASIALSAGTSGLFAPVASRLGRATPTPPAAGTTSAPEAFTVIARIEPPAYTGLAAQDVTNPDRIEAVEGTVLRVTVRPAGDWRIRFGAAAMESTRSATETSARTVLSESSYLAIDASPGAKTAARKLIAVSVTPDRAPVVRIERPGKDLVFPNARGSVAVSAAANDDFGLQSLELRYTKVSGSGEQFEFQEGTLPLAVTTESGRSWKAQAEIALSPLELDPGDVVVYRAVARDRRTGDEGLATSDTYFIEIAAPGQVALEGFALPPDRERYALSQQMILLKLQRLQAREAGLPRPRLEEETGNIAAEQRAVRANFVFLMGGTVEDEEVEAQQSHEIQEGRLENTARKEISTAIQYMTRVEQALAAVSTGQAIPPARAAVDALQRAFGRNRYILRMLSTRSRIDPSRRLSGELSGASDWPRDVEAASLDGETREARALLAQLVEVAGAIADGRALDLTALAALPERALAIGPAADDWQQTSRRLAALRDAVGAHAPAKDQLAMLDDVLPAVIRRAGKGARAIPETGVGSPGALLGSWAAREPRAAGAKEKRP